MAAVRAVVRAEEMGVAAMVAARAVAVGAAARRLVVLAVRMVEAVWVVAAMVPAARIYTPFGRHGRPWLLIITKP